MTPLLAVMQRFERRRVPALIVACLALTPLPTIASPWVYCVAGAGILTNPEASRDCVPPKAPESDQTPFPEGDDT